MDNYYYKSYDDEIDEIRTRTSFIFNGKLVIHSGAGVEARTVRNIKYRDMDAAPQEPVSFNLCYSRKGAYLKDKDGVEIRIPRETWMMKGSHEIKYFDHYFVYLNKKYVYGCFEVIN